MLAGISPRGGTHFGSILVAASDPPRHMSIRLTHKELVLITGRKSRGAQLRTLVALGIECKVAPDGKVVVSTGYAEKLLGFKMRKSF